MRREQSALLSHRETRFRREHRTWYFPGSDDPLCWRETLSLEGKVALVVGAASPVGRAISRSLAEEDCNVVLAGSRADQSLAEEFPAKGGQTVSVTVDPTDALSTESMVRGAADRFGRIDVMVNVGSFHSQLYRGAWDQIDVDEWDRYFEMIVRGAWLCCRAVAPFMKDQRSGRIVNIGSTVPWSGAPGFLHWVTATSALIGLTRAVARELGDFNVTVNLVCHELPPEDEGSDEQWTKKAVAPSEPALGRMITPEDVSGAVVFLAGEGSEFITGQSYLVNGGALFQ